MWHLPTFPFDGRTACFSALTLGFFDVAPLPLLCFVRCVRFSALTLGFFDVARVVMAVMRSRPEVSVP